MNQVNRLPKGLASLTSTTLFVVMTAIASHSAQAQESELPGANCSYNATTPIIPDGNIATQDELISAQKRIKAYQESLLDFRECLIEVEKSLDPEAEDYQSIKDALLDRSNASIDVEEKVAEEFNTAIRTYKSRG